MRIVLGILILFSFIGAVDDWWRSPVLLVLPILGVVCFVLASRIAAQDRKIRELEKLLRTQFREQKPVADSSSMGGRGTCRCGDCFRSERKRAAICRPYR